MSIMIMSRLFKMNLGGCNRKLLAVRLADFADDEGRGIYPGVKRLAEETELSERTIQRILGDFVSEGILVVVREATGRRGIANAYDFDLARLFSYKPKVTGDSVSPVDGDDGVTNEQVTGDTDDADGCHGVTLTVIEPPIEPSSEREGASAASDDDRKKIEKAFLKWHPTWPAYPNGSEDAARKCWHDLTTEQRAACIERTPAFVAAVKASKGGKFTYAAVYLKERAWERLENPKDEIGPPSIHDPFSQPWMALFLAEMLKPMSTVWPTMTSFQKQHAASGPEAARTVELERRSKYGWPKASRMVSEQKPMTVPAMLVGISESFVGIDPDSDLAKRWRALFEGAGMPWPTSGFNRLQVPAGEPAEAMAEFRKTVARERGNDDAA